MSRIVAVHETGIAGFETAMRQTDPIMLNVDDTASNIESLTIFKGDVLHQQAQKNHLFLALGSATHLVVERSFLTTEEGGNLREYVEMAKGTLELYAYSPNGYNGLFSLDEREDANLAVEETDDAIRRVEDVLYGHALASRQLKQVVQSGGGNVGMDLMTHDGWGN